MVVREDGSKWACQSCLKGHRVSGCTHTDRELTLVPKKGRPVTQCQHCRLERKKRAAHVKCDCGEAEKSHHSKEKCIHLRDAEERARAGSHDEHAAFEKDPAYLAAVADDQGCCCHHGGNCSCASLKREIGEGGPHGPAVKPRLEKTSSEGAIPLASSSHHKPVHRNHAAHDYGMPYKMPIPRSHTEENIRPTRRSVDSLALDGNMPNQPSGFAPNTSAPFGNNRRMSKSEQHSPKLGGFALGCSGLSDDKFARVDFSALAQTPTDQAMSSATSDTFAFPPFDPMTGVTDGAFDAWPGFSAVESNMPNNNPFGVWPTSTDASMVQPALTAASSGTVSEIDEIPQMEDMYGLLMPSIQEDAGSPDLTNMASSNSPQSNRRSLPPGMFGNADFSMNFDCNDYQIPIGNYSAVGGAKPRSEQNSPMQFGDVWQMPASIPNSTQRSVGGVSNGARPQSRSIGPGSTSDDIFKELFPGLDMSGFGMANSLPAGSGNRSIDDMDTSFTTRPYADNPMSIPDASFADSYDMSPDFSNPNFSANWSQ